MAPQFSAENTALWTDFAEILRQEFQTEDDSAKKAQILLAMARIFDQKLKIPDEAHKYLTAALKMKPNDPSICWDLWRSSARRSADYRISALEKLIPTLERPDDIISAKIWLAKLLKFHFQDDQRAEAIVAEAAEVFPEHRSLLWFEAELAARRGDVKALSSSYLRLAQLTSDSALRAALLVEVVHIERDVGSNRGRMCALLTEAVEEPAADWLVVSDVLRFSAELDDWVLHVKALERMADEALKQEPDPDTKFPPGHSFLGYDRGVAFAAAYWWQIAMVSERRLGDPRAAFSALERVSEIIGPHPFIDLEKARMLEASNRPADALEFLAGNDAPLYKAQLALQAGRNDESIEYLTKLEDSGFGGALLSVAGGQPQSPPDLDGDSEPLLDWLHAHPGHADSHRVAVRLGENGSEAPLARLIRLEDPSRRHTWKTDVTADEDAPWSPAVDALLPNESQESHERALTFKKWAEHASDVSLESTLLSVAARVLESHAGEGEEALELFLEAERLDRGLGGHSKEVLRLLHRLGKWPEVAERLKEIAETATSETTTRIANFERALIHEFALRNPTVATEIVSDLLAGEPSDVAAAWTMVRLSFCQENWRRAADELERLALLCPEDKGSIELILGEIHLFAIGDFDQALMHFQNATYSADRGVSQAAKIYTFYIQYQLGDVESLAKGLKRETCHPEGQENTASVESDSPEEELGSNPLLRHEPTDDDEEAEPLTSKVPATSSWIPELFEMTRAAHGVEQARELFKQMNLDGPQADLWRLMTQMDAEHLRDAKESLHNLAELTENRRIAASARMASRLLDVPGETETHETNDVDMSSPEALWYFTERLTSIEDQSILGRLYEARAALHEDDDPLEWADWVLCRAETFEKSGNWSQALILLDEALEKVGDHPGLLEAKVRVSREDEQWSVLADTHRRLAAYYATDKEKAHQLAQAAIVFYKNLADEIEAKELCEEALRLWAANPEANELLSRILKKKGDEWSVVKLLERRIDDEEDPAEKADLYEVKADQLFALDDAESAIEALDQIIALDPSRLSAYVTKMEMLVAMEKWEEVIITSKEYAAICDDLPEVRETMWRAADLMVLELGDYSSAIESLESLVRKGDKHPDTERRIADYASKINAHEKVVSALTRLMDLLEDGEQKAKIQLEAARIHLETFFDDETASRLVDDILREFPADIPTLRFAQMFKAKQDFLPMISRAKHFLRGRLNLTPTDLKMVEDLKTLAILGVESDLGDLCDDVISLLGNKEYKPVREAQGPAIEFDYQAKEKYLYHPDELPNAAQIMEMSADIVGKVLPPNENLPAVNKSNLVGPKDDNQIRDWVVGVARLIGLKKLNVYVAGSDPTGSVPIAGSVPSIAIAKELTLPLSTKHRFFLGRNLWRISQGFGGFAVGDTEWPIKWIAAVFQIVVGEGAKLPVSVDKEFAARMKKSLSRKHKKILREPCMNLAGESRGSLIGWLHGGMMSADRFGLLMARNLSKVIPEIVKEIDGEAGLKELIEDPVGKILATPRCGELLKFALSEEYMAARRLLDGQPAEGEGNR